MGPNAHVKKKIHLKDAGGLGLMNDKEGIIKKKCGLTQMRGSSEKWEGRGKAGAVGEGKNCGGISWGESRFF